MHCCCRKCDKKMLTNCKSADAFLHKIGANATMKRPTGFGWANTAILSMNHFVEQLLGGNLRRWQATYEGGPIHLSSSSSWATLKGPGNGSGRHGIALPQQSAAAAWSLAREFATLVLVTTVGRWRRVRCAAGTGGCGGSATHAAASRCCRCTCLRDHAALAAQDKATGMVTCVVWVNV